MRPLWGHELNAMGRRLMSPNGTIVWLGVHPAHSLPTKADAQKACFQMTGFQTTNKQPIRAAFVANTETKDKEGDHWVAFFLPSPYHEAPTHGAYFFDPLGRHPIDNGHKGLG